MLRRIASSGIAAAAALALTTPAMAGTVDVDFLGIGLGRGVKVDYFGSTKNVFAGQLRHNFSNGTGDASQLSGDHITFCTELSQYVSKNSSEFELVDLGDAPNSPGPMGSDKAEAVSEIWAGADGAQFATDATSHNRNFAAAFQIAIWEIVTDFDGTPSSLDVEGGNLKVTRTDGNQLSSGITSILGDLFNVIGSGNGIDSLFAVSSGNFQDQLVQLNMIPLPSGLMMGVFGLAGLGLIGRRARRQTA